VYQGPAAGINGATAVPSL